MSEPRAPYGSRDPAELRRVTTNVRTLRDAANQEAREAMRALEEALVRALDGERLLETPNLATSNEPIFGYRIRSKEADTPLRYGPMPTLILDATGRLVMAWRTRDGIGWRAALDEDLRGEDLQRLLEVFEVAVDRHMARAEHRSRRFSRIRELADKVTFLLGGDES